MLGFIPLFVLSPFAKIIIIETNIFIQVDDTAGSKVIRKDHQQSVASIFRQTSNGRTGNVSLCFLFGALICDCICESITRFAEI